MNLNTKYYTYYWTFMPKKIVKALIRNAGDKAGGIAVRAAVDRGDAKKISLNLLEATISYKINQNLLIAEYCAKNPKIAEALGKIAAGPTADAIAGITRGMI